MRLLQTAAGVEAKLHAIERTGTKQASANGARKAFGQVARWQKNGSRQSAGACLAEAGASPKPKACETEGEHISCEKAFKKASIVTVVVISLATTVYIHHHVLVHHP